MNKRLINPDKLCLGCMREIETQDRPCPYCNFSIGHYQRSADGLPLREILNGKYLIGKIIGIGGFGITYIAWDFYQGKKVCIKEYFPRRIAARNVSAHTYAEQLSVSIHWSGDVMDKQVDPNKLKQVYMKGLESYMKEAETLSKFYLMPGIVSVRDFFIGNRTAYIVMEYIDGVNLKQYAQEKGGRLMPEEVFSLLRDALKALNEVHKKNIIHRDISPDNIMLTKDGKAKLIDFGATKDYVNNRNEPVLLKHGYAPPEQYVKEGNQGPWSDVYSMCATMYYLLTGIKIPNAGERRKNDTVRLLQAMGIPISEKQDRAILKGLSLDIENRYLSIADLYLNIYGETI